MKVLLLNPPNKYNVLRDYYCSHISKGSYLWPPLDLMYLSGLLFEENIDYSVLDCIAYKHGKYQAIKYISLNNPDYIIALTGAASFKYDLIFFKKIKQEFPFITLIITGDIIYHYGDAILENHKEIDGIIKDFSDTNISKNIKENMKKGIFGNKNIKKGDFKLSIPDFSCFISKKYFLPYLPTPSFSTILTTISCPEKCYFCPFENIPYKRRGLNEIFKELLELKKYGIKFLFIRDQSFIPNEDYYIKIIDMLKDLGFRYSISARVKDLIDENSIKRLKNSGCYLVQIGVESSNDKYIKGKILDKKSVKKVFSSLRKNNIKSLAHFIVGFQEESLYTILRNLKYIYDISPDYLSLNTLTPEPGTTLFDNTFSNGFDFDKKILDSSVSSSIMKNKRFKTITNIHRKILSIVFYSSPRFLYNSLFKTNLYQKKIMLKELYNSIRMKGSRNG